MPEKKKVTIDMSTFEPISQGSVKMDMSTFEPIGAASPPVPREAAMGREFALGAMGTVLPETQTPLRTLAEGAKPDFSNPMTYIDPTGIGRGVYGMGKALAKGIGEVAPVVGKMAFQPNAPITPEEKEAAAHGAGTLGGIGLQAMLALRSAPRAANAKTSLTRQIGENIAARPQTVEYQWAKGALDILKRAKRVDYAAKIEAYPKIEAVFNRAELDAILPRNLPEGQKSLTGIRAAREKLDMAGATEKGIRDARRELWTYLKRPSLPSDEFKAYGDAYGKLTGELRKPFEQAGKLDEFMAAEKGFAQHMETFSGPDSPIAKALDAEMSASGFVEPSTVFKQFSKQVAGQQVESLGGRKGVGFGPLEMFRMRQIGKFSDPAFSSGIAFTLKIPLVRQALEYLLTRPAGIGSLKPMPPLPKVAKRLGAKPPDIGPPDTSFVKGVPAGPGTGQPIAPKRSTGLEGADLSGPIEVIDLPNGKKALIIPEGMPLEFPDAPQYPGSFESRQPYNPYPAEVSGQMRRLRPLKPGEGNLGKTPKAKYTFKSK